MAKTFATYTLGCKVNQYETNALEEIFIENGYILTDFDKYADLYIINTCTVTAMSDRKSRQMIRRAKKRNKDALVVVIGCYSQISPDEVAKIDDVNLIMGTSDKKSIYDEVQKLSLGDKVVKVGDLSFENKFENLDTKAHSKNQRAFLKIQDGCDRYCTYCIIPYTRGKVRSRKLDDIVKEVMELAQNGYREIVLTGIHVASYGKDFVRNKKKLVALLGNNLYDEYKAGSHLKEEYAKKQDFEKEDIKKEYSRIRPEFEETDTKKQSLLEVIQETSKIDGIERIRIGSLESVIITDEFLQGLSKIDKFCPHFHLSLQSGCNDTLSRMNRRYTAEEYEDSLIKIRKYFKNPAITTDVIVGFPGETEQEFAKTCEFLKKIKLYQMHIFPYSGRSGTKAYGMPNQIDEAVKHERVLKLKDLDAQNRREFEENMLGEETEVLFEKKENGFFEGHTGNYVKVHVDTDEDISGKILKVKITNRSENRLFGKLTILF